MIKKNPNVVQCPIHGLHFDQSKQEGCALCIRAQQRLEQKREEVRKTSGTELIRALAVSAGIAILVWAILYFVFPPKIFDESEDLSATISFSDPEGWQEENSTHREIALERLGLRSEDTKWAIKGRYVFESENPNENNFLEYIQVLKGPGAFFIEPDAIPEIKKEVAGLKPTTAFETEVSVANIVDVGMTKAVKMKAKYKSKSERYSADVYYIPAGNIHYIVTLAAHEDDWFRYQPAFDAFVSSISGGKQGTGKARKLPEFLTSSHRAYAAAILAFVLSLWIIVFFFFKR